MAEYRLNCQKSLNIVFANPGNLRNSAPFVSKQGHYSAIFRFGAGPAWGRPGRLGCADFRQRHLTTTRCLRYRPRCAARPGQARVFGFGCFDDRTDKAGSGFHVLVLLTAPALPVVIFGSLISLAW